MSRCIWPNGAPDRAAHRATLLDRMLGDWPEIGGYWVAKWRDRPGFLGWCGLFPLEDSGLVEIGCRYCQRAWGQGVGSEAATVLDHGFRQLALDPIVALTNPGNRASQRFLAKIGLAAAGAAFTLRAGPLVLPSRARPLSAAGEPAGASLCRPPAAGRHGISDSIRDSISNNANRRGFRRLSP